MPVIPAGSVSPQRNVSVVALVFLGLLDPITGDVQLQDHAVMNEPVDGRGGDHRIFEDCLP